MSHTYDPNRNLRLIRVAERIAAKTYGGRWTVDSEKPKDGAKSA